MATNSEPDDRILLTVRDVARRLQVHEVTVRRHILAGRLKALRVGKSVRVTPKDLEEYLGPVGPEAPKAPERTRVADPAAAYESRSLTRGRKSPPRNRQAESGPVADGSEQRTQPFAWPEPHPDLDLRLAEIRAIREAIAREPKPRRLRTPRPLTKDSGIWKIIGIADVPGIEDVSTNKHKHLADIYDVNKT